MRHTLHSSSIKHCLHGIDLCQLDVQAKLRAMDLGNFTSTQLSNIVALLPRDKEAIAIKEYLQASCTLASVVEHLLRMSHA